MSQYHGVYSCGHEGVINITGPTLGIFRALPRVLQKKEGNGTGRRK